MVFFVQSSCASCLRGLLFSAVILAGCASNQVMPTIDPARMTPVETPADHLPPELPLYSQASQLAFQMQKMPLYTTGIPRFLADHPTWDGRGVLIAILDSGIDAGIPGLGTTSTGERKIVDLRDFSGEGRIALAPITPVHDTVTVGGVRLGGFGRVVLFNAAGPWYAGALRESALGIAPAADVDANGRVDDILPVVVTRASDGWILLADTDRNGSLQGEKPIRDYLVSREPFSWAWKGILPRHTFAANFSESAGLPVLDLIFDTSGHGSHVAGIAAGHDMYGISGFNGVAPGAQIIGLKIANDAQGGLSTGGSMIRAMDYAIRFAARRRMPLVLNMSFAVGNEIEGKARIDQLVDSVLALHPELVFTISAGNDGPGLSTLGFPGSASRALTVGAVLPGDPSDPMESRMEPVTYYSARGGELAKPDFLAPGSAYSTVPAWDRGSEVKSGTSMAAPHASGLVALLYSAFKSEDRTLPRARAIRQALMVTARPIPGATYPDQGAGIPDISAAWRWLKDGRSVEEIDVRAEGGVSAAYRATGLSAKGDTLQRFYLVRPAGLAPATFSLRSNATWLVAPPFVTLTDTLTPVTLRYRADVLAQLGTSTGAVSGWPADTLAGPAFRLVNTIAQAVRIGSELHESAAMPILPGDERRLVIQADSGQPFEVSARIGGRFPLLVFLHEPSGQFLRGAQPQIAGAGQEEVTFKVDGRDVVAGAYELVAVAPPTEPSSARFDVRRPPVKFDARREEAGIVARISSDSVSGERQVRMMLIGGESQLSLTGRGNDTVTRRIDVPSWAARLVVDLTMAREQWGQFTDFGMTLLDSAGRQIDHAPLDYSFGRITASFDQDHSGQTLSVALFPAPAEPGSREPWSAAMSIRLYAADELPLSAAQGGPSSPESEETTLFALPPLPWALPGEVFPLGLLEVTHRGLVWTREVWLPETSAPATR